MKLEIVTPEKLVFSQDVPMATLPGVEGDFGVLKDHSPLIAELREGEVLIFPSADSTEPNQRIPVAGGVAQVTADSCTVLVA